MTASRRRRAGRPPGWMVFPWWFLAGCIAAALLVDPASTGTTVLLGAVWAPVLGIIGTDRRERLERLDRSQWSRRRGSGPWWRDAPSAVAFTLASSGMVDLIGGLRPHVNAGQELRGLLLVIPGSVGLILLWLLRRARADRARQHVEAEVRRLR